MLMLHLQLWTLVFMNTPATLGTIKLLRAEHNIIVIKPNDL